MSSQSCQFVTDPYKSDFNPGDKNGSILYNKATEALQETAQFTFSQEKAATLLQRFKRQSQRFFWGQTVNKVQVFPSEKTTTIDISDK